MGVRAGVRACARWRFVSNKAGTLVGSFWKDGNRTGMTQQHEIQT